MSMEVRLVTNKKELEDAYKVRKIVFVEEQNVPVELEMDEYEETAAHFVLYDNDEPIGAGRFRIIDNIGKVERICVTKEQRSSGGGRIIMEKIEQYAKEKGLPKLKLNAQIQAIPFYSRLGFTVSSDEFLDAGIPHKTMIKEL